MNQLFHIDHPIIASPDQGNLINAYQESSLSRRVIQDYDLFADDLEQKISLKKTAPKSHFSSDGQDHLGNQLTRLYDRILRGQLA